FLEFAVADQAGEGLAAGDVGPLTDHREIAVGTLGERQRAAEAKPLRLGGRLVGLIALHAVSDGRDVLGRGAAAAANDVEPTVIGPFTEHFGHGFGAKVILAHFVGQAGIGIAADRNAGDV